MHGGLGQAQGEDSWSAAHYTRAQPAHCPPPSHSVHSWELWHPAWVVDSWELWDRGCPAPHCQPAEEFMCFYNMAKVQKGEDLARMDVCLSTEAADQKTSWFILLLSYRSQILNQKTSNPGAAIDLPLPGGKLVRWADLGLQSVYLTGFWRANSYTWVYGWLDIL